MLVLIDTPTGGKYLFNGNDTSFLRDKEAALLRNKKIGFIYQHFALIKEYTVLENIMLPFRVRKGSKKEKRELTEKYFQEVGLIDCAKKYPNELSGGQQQRIAIARALDQETDVILADKPTGNLDQGTGIEIMKLLKNINSKGKTLIVVTHDENIVTYCGRRIGLKDGEVISDNLIK